MASKIKSPGKPKTQNNEIGPNLKKNLFLVLVWILILGTAAYLRFYNINFGLPQSFHADEPELVEPAIKYTYEIRKIISNRSYEQLIPISFVYGQVPTYILTPIIMTSSKLMNTLGYAFSKETLYVIARALSALLSLVIIPLTLALFNLVNKRESANKIKAALVVVLATAYNWKLIVIGHYANADIYLTFFTLLSSIFFLQYIQSSTKKFLVLSAVFFGLSVGTKVTALIVLPIYFFLLFKNKRIFAIAIFTLLTFGAFIFSNPFSWALAQDFAFRVLTLATKENGLVFDSANLSYTKYLVALAQQASPIVLAAAVLATAQTSLKLFRKKENDTDRATKDAHIYLILYAMFYIVFYSISNRLVDRWLLPVLPIVFVYAGVFIEKLNGKLGNIIFALFVLLLIYSYGEKAFLLTKQYQRQTPKSEAYIWAQSNISGPPTKLVVTEEGLDPMNKLPSTTVLTFNVYESENAYLEFPPNPSLYNYVILSSRPMSYFKNPIISEKYPTYVAAWYSFESTIQNKENFELIRSFSLPKPDLINVSDVHVYKNLNK